PYTSSYDFAEPCVFDKQSPGPFNCGPPVGGRPFSRSYRSILPSSLAMNLSSTLEFSSQLPVSVYGTGCFTRFSWKLLLRIITATEALVYYHTLSGTSTCYSGSTHLIRISVTFIVSRYRNINLLSIHYSAISGFALGPD